VTTLALYALAALLFARIVRRNHGASVVEAAIVGVLWLPWMAWQAFGADHD
jgi:hypothetical protein